MKKTKKLLILLLITAVLSAGLTLAFMFRTTGPVNNQFEPAQVTCDVVENHDTDRIHGIQVKNDSNISCYVRVRLVTYWVNAKNEIVGKPSPTLNVPYDNIHWKAGADNTFYYLTPLEVNGKADDLLPSGTELVLQTDEFNGEPVYQVVNAFAEAIQANPKTAVQEAWLDFTIPQN